MDGLEVDIVTLKPLEAAQVPSPKPKKPLDSVANDKTYEHGVGEPKPNMPGGKAPNQPVKKPEVLTRAIPDGAQERDESDEDLEQVVQEVYDAFSRQELEDMAAEYGVDDLTGNKTDVAKRFVEAGLRVEAAEENEG
jgi:hypothetical protein